MAYQRGHPSAALAWNGLVPLLVFGASVLAMLSNPPSRITAGGVLLMTVPAVVLLACVAGWRLPGPHPVLFWGSWFANLAIIAFLGYLSFLFRIF